VRTKNSCVCWRCALNRDRTWRNKKHDVIHCHAMHPNRKRRELIWSEHEVLKMDKYSKRPSLRWLSCGNSLQNRRSISVLIKQSVRYISSLSSSYEGSKIAKQDHILNHVVAGGGRRTGFVAFPTKAFDCCFDDQTKTSKMIRNWNRRWGSFTVDMHGTSAVQQTCGWYILKNNKSKLMN